MNTLTHTNTQLKKPIVLFDPDCLFCRWWVYRWECFTKNKIDYKPFTDKKDEFPSVAEEDFLQAVHLMLPNGEYFRGAHAVLYLLHVADRHRWWYWAYIHVPGCAWFLEYCYRLIATHRPFFAKLTVFFFGQNPTPRVMQQQNNKRT